MKKILLSLIVLFLYSSEIKSSETSTFSLLNKQNQVFALISKNLLACVLSYKLIQSGISQKNIAAAVFNEPEKNLDYISKFYSNKWNGMGLPNLFVKFYIKLADGQSLPINEIIRRYSSYTVNSDTEPGKLKFLADIIKRHADCAALNKNILAINLTLITLIASLSKYIRDNQK